MDARARIVKEAEKYLGLVELTGNNDGEPSRLFVFGEQKPWCGGFVARVYRDANADLPGNIYLLPSVDYIQEQLIKAGRFQDPGHVPEAGDIILFRTRGRSDKGPGRHCGIVTHVLDGFIFTIEGNTSNEVARRRWAASDASIVGFGIVAPDTAPVPGEAGR